MIVDMDSTPTPNPRQPGIDAVPTPQKPVVPTRPTPYNAYPQNPSISADGSPQATTKQPGSSAPQAPNRLSGITPPPPVASKSSRLVPESIRGFISTAIFIGSVLVVAMLINNFIFQSYYVDGTSMEPTLQNNDRLIIDKTAHTIADIKRKPYMPERGEIIVLDSSIVGVNGRHEQLIKRVIGLPGETVKVKDGVITIVNSAAPDGFNADQILALKLSATYVDEDVDVTLGDNQLFVVGDNRAPGGSFDSREFGPIEADQVEGRLVIRVFPFNHITVY